MTRLLCATDLRPKSEAAIDRAGILAGEIGASLSLLHVVSASASERVLEESLRMAISRMKSRARMPAWRHGPTPNVLVRAGNPARVICDTVAEEPPDLLIVGPHERRNALEGVSGTIAEKVLSTRKCPLLVVRGKRSANYTNVLLALDLEAESSLAVRAAESLVLSKAAQALVVHARRPPLRGMVPSPYAAAPSTPDREEIHALLKQAGADLGRYEVLVEEGLPIAAILRAIENHKPDLLVMGTRGGGRLRRALLGSVASQLLQEVDGCDVLVVPRDSMPAAANGH